MNATAKNSHESIYPGAQRMLDEHRRMNAPNRVCRCESCGEKFPAGRIEHKRVLNGRGGRYEDWCPDEWIEVCPECGAGECIERLSEDESALVLTGQGEFTRAITPEDLR